MESLSGQRAVVVGTASQHAAGLLRTLREAGADLTVVDRSPAAGVTVVCDMTETGIAAAMQTLGAIDILVTTPPSLVEAPTDTDAATLSAAVATVLEPAFLWTAAVAASMRVRGSGVIVHVTGPSGLGGWRGWAAAGMAFAAIHNLVESFAIDVAASGVRVNALVPGVTQRQAERIAADLRQPLDFVTRRIPLGAVLPDEALCNALLYIVHQSSSYVSGEILTVDGGWSMWGRLHAVAS